MPGARTGSTNAVALPRPSATPSRAVHGLAGELVEPDWPELTEEELTEVFARYPLLSKVSRTLELIWRSPRPMSSAALVTVGARTVFVKRHDTRVRSSSQLEEEHAFASFLHGAGVAVPNALRTGTGASVVSLGNCIYEIHELAGGVDLYRDAMSWEPYSCLGHARSAGSALARFHEAAHFYRGRRRPPGVLMSSCEIVAAKAPFEQLEHLIEQRPGLARYLDRRNWREDFERYHLFPLHRAAPLVRNLRPQWSHGDWHPSNLTWTSAGHSAQVAGIFDLGLSNRTFAVHDIAVAIERAAVGWLSPAGMATTEADLGIAGALLDGYEHEHPLNRGQLRALAALLPVVHIEYALSEVEYFADVLGNEPNADIAYYAYLIGHTKWFSSAEGARLTDYICKRSGSRS